MLKRILLALTLAVTMLSAQDAPLPQCLPCPPFPECPPDGAPNGGN
jgi:hypothetical protein